MLKVKGSGKPNAFTSDQCVVDFLVVWKTRVGNLCVLVRNCSQSVQMIMLAGTLKCALGVRTLLFLCYAIELYVTNHSAKSRTFLGLPISK